jgi:uncharacterized protein (TIGR03118 family)
MSDNVSIGNASGTYDFTAGDDSVITVGNGNDTIGVSGGTDASIRIGNGDDTLIATSGTGDDIRIGNGDDSVTLSGGSDNTVKAGNGNDSVTTSGEDDDMIIVRNGNDMVNAGADSAVTAGNGNDTLTAGADSTISAGNGNDMVNAAGPGNAISLGNGNDMVTAGSGSTIKLGNGNDAVSAGRNSAIHAGNGNDSVTAGAGSTITLGNGNNSVIVTPYLQTNLVSDISGLATITDPQLMNPWGFSHSSGSPFWVSNNDPSTTTLYAVTGPTGTNVTKAVINPPSGFVEIPPFPPTAGSGPTGQVNNTNTSSFLVGNGGNNASAHFIFANMNGTISAWDTGTTAFTEATTPGACYTGLTISQTLSQPLLYAANNAGTGSIDVFNGSWGAVAPGTGGLVAGAFATPATISALGLDPFNVQDIGGNVYVTYALPGNAQDHAALGEGAVAKFTESGALEQSIVGGNLASPWGIALAPTTGFGPFSGDLLVGNESETNSEINAFDPVSGAYKGTIPIDVGSGNTPGGLWALGFGIGGSNGSPNTLYFADGINGQQDGLFGAITVGPEPASAITAGNGNNTVSPGDNSTVTLGKGNNTVFGGANDVITLGNGNDTVAFGVSPSPTAIGNEVVKGFKPAHDVIDFSVSLLSNYMAVVGATTQVGSNTVIKVDTNESVTLTNVVASTLSSSNFHFS